MLTLEGKTCIITGAAAGIGESTSRLFDSLGARVIGLDIDTERGERLERSSKNGRITFKKVDLTDREALMGFIRWAEKKVPRIDVLISSAIVPLRNNIIDVSMDAWDSSLALSLTAPFLLSRLAAKKMIAKRVPGKIILISAVQAWMPLDSSFSYAVVKGGLISMAKSLAVDLGSYGIQVTAVMPGPIYTAEKNKTEVAPKSLDERAATLLRRYGKRSEVANVLAFVASDLNTFMTGNTILVDGGRSISRRPDPAEVSDGFKGKGRI